MNRVTVRRCALLLWLVALLIPVAMSGSARSGAAMATAATRFVASLTPDQRPRTTLPFESEDRVRWHYVPTEMFPRQGLTIKEMTEPQRALARDLLKSGLSQRGYMTAEAIMNLETVLRAIEVNGRMVRDPEKYFFTVFGSPSPRGAWGWRVDGHHVSLSFTVVNGSSVASSPSFFGVNPAEVREGPQKGLRILAAEEDAARALLTALDQSQRTTAVILATAPNDIVNTNRPTAEVLSPTGIKASALNKGQRDLLMALIDVYISKMTEDVAAERLARLKTAGLENITFAWAGETEKGRQHYYRVQGPTFLIEYDNTQNDGNHIHSAWRDFNGDFGRDLLREHLRTQAH